MKKSFVVLLLLFFCITVVFAAGCGEEKSASNSGDNSSGKADYPSKDIIMICPWGTGGGTDAILRALCKAAEKDLHQTITVSNITGGGGAAGHAAIMKAKPDGYTMGMITFELNSMPPQALVPFTYKDFDPVIRVNTDAAALTVRADAPYNTVGEFVQYAKQHPGEISIGNSAVGSVWHIAAGLMAQKTGIEVKYLPFEGGAPAVNALVRGRIQAVSVSVAEVREQVEAGQLKILGIMDDKRDPLFPEVKTFREQGVDLVFGTWRGIALPQNVKPEVKKVIVDVFTKAVKDPDFIKFAKKMGLTISYQDSDQFARFLDENAGLVDKTMDKIGLKRNKSN
ncbi:MAG: tripartite tricarboxylate transporter substrate binding protein [Selenomonadaceae bacterium]